MAVKKIQKRTCASVKHNYSRKAVKYEIQKKGEPNKNVNNQRSFIIAQEIKFAKSLASNDKKVRDKALKSLKKWFTVRCESSFAFTEADFMRIWKGLFYHMWMSDKPLIQEESAKLISKLVRCFTKLETVLLYTKCTLKTLAIEWFGIDRYRVDKFQMLTRRIVRETFAMCKKRSWDEESVSGIEQIIEELLLDKKASLGFTLHITEIYLEELAKVSDGDIPEEVVTELIKPFVVQLAGMNDEREIRHVMKYIFRHLIFQSNIGMEYSEKFEAWKRAGFPGGKIDTMQKFEISDDEDNEDLEEKRDTKVQSQESFEGEKVLDPRAGRVDVEIPQIPFNSRDIADLLMEHKFHPSSTTKTRKQIIRLADEFSELSQGEMPLGLKEVKLPISRKSEMNSKKAAKRLLDFEKELYSDTIRGKLKRKKRNHATTKENEDIEELLVPPTQFELQGAIVTDKLSSVDLQSDDELTNVRDSLQSIVDDDSPKVESKKKRKHKLNVNSIARKKCKSDRTLHAKRKKRKNLNEKETLNNEDNKNVEKGNKTQRNKSGSSKKLKLKAKSELSGGLHDGIDDFKYFISTLTPVREKNSKATAKGNSWDVSDNNDTPTPSTPRCLVRYPNGSKEKQNFNNQSNSPILAGISPTNNKLVWLTPVLATLEKERVKSQSHLSSHADSNSMSKKRVKIMLQRNTAQHTSEYIRQLRQSPAIPYDANRKPPVGVLKPSPVPSPVNPFYKRNVR